MNKFWGQKFWGQSQMAFNTEIQYPQGAPRSSFGRTCHLTQTPPEQTPSKHGNNKGFTLLEVMVAITLTALVLGNLLALQSQSKQLSFKAQSTLAKTINQRAYLNAAWISNRALDSYMDELSETGYTVDNKKELKKPEEQTKPLKFSLQSFDIVDENKQVVLSSVRVKETIVSRQ